MTAKTCPARFRIELEGAPWVYEIAVDPTEAQRKGFALIKGSDPGSAYLVQDRRKGTSRRFEYDGMYVRETTFVGRV